LSQTDPFYDPHAQTKTAKNEAEPTRTSSYEIASRFCPFPCFRQSFTVPIAPSIGR